MVDGFVRSIYSGVPNVAMAKSSEYGGQLSLPRKFPFMVLLSLLSRAFRAVFVLLVNVAGAFVCPTRNSSS